MTQARITIEGTPVAPVRRRLFGSFIEHLGRAVYDGIYEPGHPTADDDGFRTDVIELVKELGVSAIRYPGGNFVSSFKWEDSVGPVESRPRRLDLAWHSTETNQIGMHEFAGWLDKVGSELMLAINLGTRGTGEALDLLEYSNLPAGTAFATQRAANGRQTPFDIRMWCLGNEMDGPWQIGHRSADDYGKLAAQTARAMRAFDPSLELVLCGSSSAHMPTFGAWEQTVLEHAYDEVDYISCHAYYELKDGDVGSFLASAVDMDHFIEVVAETIDLVKEQKGSAKTVAISFDEWNVWYNTRFETVDRIDGVDNWPVAPRLLEDVYTVADAVVVGNLLISLLRHADRVTSASLAQLVNVIAPIMTEPGGAAWRQTTFFPFATTSRLAVGSVVELQLDTPGYATAQYGEVPLLDAVATRDEQGGRVALFAVNRSLTETLDVTVEGTRAVRSAVVLTDADITAANTRDEPDRVGLAELPHSLDTDGRVVLHLPPVSWAAIELGV
jgi:alpha-L-arabinofuranosidase